jgi:23S rRNA (cytosine1962-C5)-methyltransferase
VRFGVDLPGGQKTGLYLDQADNYGLVAAHAAGRNVLDCFSNQGGFALACALAGAARVTALDVSADACAAIRDNARRNDASVSVTEANVFDWLKSPGVRHHQHDLIILDPPSFTRDRARLNDALRGYKEIHLRAASLLEPGGLLATFCCSHHVSAHLFLDTILEALVDAKRTARLRATYAQRPDHPVVLGLPESSYLKGFLLEMMPGR